MLGVPAERLRSAIHNLQSVLGGSMSRWASQTMTDVSSSARPLVCAVVAWHWDSNLDNNHLHLAHCLGGFRDVLFGHPWSRWPRVKSR